MPAKNQLASAFNGDKAVSIKEEACVERNSTQAFLCWRGGKLFPDRLSDVLDRLSDLPFGCAESFSEFASRSVRRSLVLKIGIIKCATRFFFQVAFHLIKLSFDLILVW
jgi:hypothetical protein